MVFTTTYLLLLVETVFTFVLLTIFYHQFYIKLFDWLYEYKTKYIHPLDKTISLLSTWFCVFFLFYRSRCKKCLLVVYVLGLFMFLYVVNIIIIYYSRMKTVRPCETHLTTTIIFSVIWH